MVKRFVMFALLLGIFVVPVLVATGAASAQGNSEAAKACQKGGYADLQGTDGTRFANTGECVSFAARGGELTQIPPQSLTLSFTTVDNTAFCGIAVQLVSFPANTTVPVDIDVSGYTYHASMTTDALGNAFGHPIGTYVKGPWVTLSAGGLTAGPSTISC